MNRHLSDNEIHQYRRRTIAPDEVVAASEHLSQCDDCYRRFNPNPDLKRAYTSFRSAVMLDEDSVSDHLSYEELSGHVDGTLNGSPADRCWAHIEICPACREDVEELREFKAGAQASGEPAVKPSVQPVSGDVNRPVRIQPVRLAPTFRMAALAASILIVAAGAVWLVTAGLRREITSLRGQLDQMRSENETLRQDSSELKSLRNRVAELTGFPTPNESPPGGASPVVTSLRDRNGIIQVHKDGGLAGLESAPEDLQEAVRLTLMTSRLERPNLDSLKGEPGVLMGDAHGGASFSVTSPVGVVVEEARPLLEWTWVPGAVTCRVTITDVRSGRAFASPPISKSHWQPSKPLPRGRTYSWAVTAQVAGGREIFAPAPPAPIAQFKVISASEENRLLEARRLVPRSHLLEAVLYARAGLMDAARKELQALAAVNPQSQLVRRLLERVRDRDSGK
jgi:hypothetical protein